jgi:hypothetical protein
LLIGAIGDHSHDLAGPAHRGHRQATAQRLRQTNDVGSHSKTDDRTSPTHGQSGFDLVEDQKGFMMTGELA